MRPNYKIPTVLLTGAPEPPAGSELADMVLLKGCDPQAFLSNVAQLLMHPEASTDGDPQNHN